MIRLRKLIRAFRKRSGNVLNLLLKAELLIRELLRIKGRVICISAVAPEAVFLLLPPAAQLRYAHHLPARRTESWVVHFELLVPLLG